jgi:hypothetical protein
MASAGVDTVTVVSGRYTVGFIAPSGYQIMGQTAIAGVAVAARDSVPVVFAVRATWAELFIVAELEGPPWPSDGGRVGMLRADTADQVAFTIPVPFSSEGYFVDVSLMPGTYQANYVPPEGFQATANSSTAEITMCPADRMNLTFAAAPAAGVRARGRPAADAAHGQPTRPVRPTVPW